MVFIYGMRAKAYVNYPPHHIFHPKSTICYLPFTGQILKRILPFQISHVKFLHIM